MLSDNKYNFDVSGDLSSYSIDTSNLVNSKPVYYLMNQKDLVIAPATYPQVGYLALINCINTTVEDMTLTNNGQGLLLANTNSSKITNNQIENNVLGVSLIDSSNNSIYHNNFINNTLSASIDIEGPMTNVWDDGYPSGGNYWSDYNGTDANHDGIGDTSYVIDTQNADNYPLMGTFYEFTVPDGMLYNIATVSNFTILDLYSLHELRIDGSWYLVLEFTAVIPKGTVGFCRIDIPRVLIDGPYHVFTLGGNFTPTELPISNSSHAFLYFTFDHSGPVIIVPEFPSLLILPLFFITTLFSAINYQKRRQNRSFHVST
jgi:parallel beta-helix repeat protein